MDEIKTVANLQNALDVIYKEADTSLLSGDSAVMRKALDNIRAVARYKFDVLAETDKAH